MSLVQFEDDYYLALRQVFGATYPVDDFQDLSMTIEFPYQEQQYPGVWVGWEPIGPISKAGIEQSRSMGHRRPLPRTTPNVFFLYRFSGYSLYTIGALTSMQRDRLHDELVRVFLMSGTPQVVGFRQYIEDNPYINMNMDFDTVWSGEWPRTQGPRGGPTISSTRLPWPSRRWASLSPISSSRPWCLWPRSPVREMLWLSRAPPRPYRHPLLGLISRSALRRRPEDQPRSSQRRST